LKTIEKIIKNRNMKEILKFAFMFTVLLTPVLYNYLKAICPADDFYNFQMVLATGYHVVILRAGTMTGFPVRNCRAFQSRRSTSRNVPNPAKRSGCPTRIFIMCFSTYKISITHNMAIDFAARLNILLLSYGHQVNRFLFTR
jgi:hypothetical protein